MTADLQRARVEVGEVVQVERLGDLIELTARLPHLAATARPGEFAQLRCSDTTTPLLRRPFSVAWTDGELCSFVLQEVGTGTSLLAQLRAGDALDVLGPLGRGFDADGVEGSVVCVSGGVGCAPFPLLVRALHAAGVVDITVLNGAAKAALLYPAERFIRGLQGVRVLEATDDGSRGLRARVTALLPQALESKPAAVYACGPNVMLAAVAAVLNQGGRRAAPLRAEASMEAPMGCGFGTCLGCALPVGAGAVAGWELCCCDGPVFRMDRIDWGTLLALPEASVA